MGKLRKNPTKAEMKDFLTAGITVMNSDETRALLKDKGSCPRPGQTLINLQRAQWEPLGIDADSGCAALEQIDEGDKALAELRDDFIHTSMRIYLRSLEDRRPDKLETARPMPREVIIEFMNACNVKMDLPEYRERLEAYMKEHGKMPNELIIEAQRDMLEVLGFEREHGCACLSKTAQEKQSDKELMQAFSSWQHKAQRAVMESARRFQAAGGQLPTGPYMEVPEELKRVNEQAEMEVSGLSPQERMEIIQRFQKKFQVFMNLPIEGRQSYVQKLSEADKLEFAKARILIVSMMRQQWEQSNTPGGANDVGSLLPGGEVRRPTQQQMM